MPSIRSGASISVTPSVTNTLGASLSSGTLQNDHVLLFCASVGQGNSFSCPGFTPSTPVTGTGGGGSLQLLYKINTGADAPGTTYTVTSAYGDVFGVVSCSMGYGDQSLVFDGGLGSGAILPAAGTTITTNSLTLAYPGDGLLWFGFALLPSGTNAITGPGGYTQGAQVSSTIPSVTNITLTFASVSNSPATGSGSLSATLASAALGGAMQIAIPVFRPAWMIRQYRRPLPYRQLFRSVRRNRISMLPQNTGTQFPLVIRQSISTWAKVPWRVNRQRGFSGAGLSQGQLGQAWPTVTQQRRNQANAAIIQSRLNLIRPRVTLPPGLPQGPLPPVWVPPGVPPQPGWRRFPPLLRRSKIIEPVLRQAAQGTPAIMTVSKQHPRPWAAYVKLPRRRVFTPPWPQGPLPAGTPAIVRPARTRLRPWSLRLLSRARIAMVPVPKRTQQATAHLQQSTTLSAAAHATHLPVIALRQGTSLTVLPTKARNAAAHLQQATTLKAIGSAKAFGSAALHAATMLTVSAFKTRHASAALTASTTLTATAGHSRSVHLTAPATLTVSATATHHASAALTAATALTATAARMPYSEDILIVPQAIPGVNEPPVKPPVVSLLPVTESTVQARIRDELYDP